MKHSFQYITCQAKQAALRFNLPHRDFHLPHHSVLNKSELNCEDSAKNITYRVGQTACQIAVICRIHLQLATGHAFMLHTDLTIVTPSLDCNTHPLLENSTNFTAKASLIYILHSESKITSWVMTMVWEDNIRIASKSLYRIGGNENAYSQSYCGSWWPLIYLLTRRQYI